MPKWTQEMKERRRSNSIARIQEDLQCTLDEAVEHYYKSFREKASLGGKKKTGLTGFALLDENKRKEVSAKGVEARRGKR